MRLMTFASVCCVLAFMASPVMAQKKAAQTDLTAQASQFVDDVATQAIKIVEQKRAGEISGKDAKIAFRKILNDAFDLPTIARFTMGRYWRVATPEQQKEYTRLLRVKILDKYADSILSYSGAGHKVTSSGAINDKDYNVAMVIDRKGEPSVDFGWRLRRFDKAFKVIDISVEGISMSVTHRSDFASVIERNGGKVEALLDALRNKEGDVLPKK